MPKSGKGAAAANLQLTEDTAQVQIHTDKEPISFQGPVKSTDSVRYWLNVGCRRSMPI